MDVDSARFRNELGSAFFGSRSVRQAIKQNERVVELDPRSAEAHNNLAAALAARGRVKEAIGQFRRAIELNPAFADAHNNLGAAWPAADGSTMPSAITGRRWKSSRTTPKPTIILARPWQAADSSTRRSRITRRPWKSSPDYADAHYNLGLALAGAGGSRRRSRITRRSLRTQARLRRGPERSGLAACHLPGCGVPRRSGGRRAGPTGDRAFRRQDAGNPRHAGGRVCRGGNVLRGHGDGARGPGFGPATEQGGPGGKVEGPAAALRSRNSLSAEPQLAVNVAVTCTCREKGYRCVRHSSAAKNPVRKWPRRRRLTTRSRNDRMLCQPVRPNIVAASGRRPIWAAIDLADSPPFGWRPCSHRSIGGSSTLCRGRRQRLIGSDFFQTPRGFRNLLAGNNIYLTEISDYGPLCHLIFQSPVSGRGRRALDRALASLGGLWRVRLRVGGVVVPRRVAAGVRLRRSARQGLFVLCHVLLPCRST